MNVQLARLLVDAGVTDAGDPGFWRRVILFHNAAAIPRPPAHGPDYQQRGFHLLVVDPEGQASHFAKCRPADDPRLAWERHILDAIRDDPDLARNIPPSTYASNDTIGMILSPWIAGVPFEQRAPTLPPAEWASAACGILERADTISSCIAAQLPTLRGGAEPIDVATVSEVHLDVLEREGLGPTVVAPIRAALQHAPRLTPRLQHGDLWHGNVIEWDGAWWFLDFEIYGRIQVPLYDVFHLLRSSPGRGDTSSRWLGEGLGGHHTSAWADASRTVVARSAKRAGLSPAGVGAAYLFYLTEFTANRFEVGIPTSFRVPYVEEIGRVGSTLAQGCSLEALVVT